MTTSSNDPDAIRADIERTRAELSSDVDTLTDTANPSNIAHRQADKITGAARGLRDKIMGSPDDDSDHGQVGAGLQRAGDAVSGAPSKAKDQAVRQTRGNPLAAGLIAFGAGALIGSLIPSSQREQEAVAKLGENIEPLKQKAGEAAREVADNLRGPAQEAVESVKSTASGAAEDVRASGQSAKDDVQTRAQEAGQTVRDDASSS